MCRKCQIIKEQSFGLFNKLNNDLKLFAKNLKILLQLIKNTAGGKERVFREIFREQAETTKKAAKNNLFILSVFSYQFLYYNITKCKHN